MGRHFDDQELRDQLLTFYEEVATVLDSGPPTAERLSALTYADQCVHEALPVYPPAFNFTRVSLRHPLGFEGLVAVEPREP